MAPEQEGDFIAPPPPPSFKIQTALREPPRFPHRSHRTRSLQYESRPAGCCRCVLAELEFYFITLQFSHLSTAA